MRKAIVGLKQSSRAWFGRFSQDMKKSSYSQSNGDNSLFNKHSNKGKVTMLVIYVDDIIFTRNDPTERVKLEQDWWDYKNLGKIKYYLGIEVAHSWNDIILSQQKYILELLTEEGFTDGQPAKTPIAANHRLNLNKDEKHNNTGNYQRLIGRLIYLAHTRLDISSAINILSQFMHSPRNLICKRHTRYLDTWMAQPD